MIIVIVSRNFDLNISIFLIKKIYHFFYSFYCVLRFSYRSWKDLTILLWKYAISFHIFSYITWVNIKFSSSSCTRVNRKFYCISLISTFLRCLANILLWPLKNTFTIISSFYEVSRARNSQKGFYYLTKTTRFSMLLLSNVTCFSDFWRSLSCFALATYFSILYRTEFCYIALIIYFSASNFH